LALAWQNIPSEPAGPTSGSTTASDPSHEAASSQPTADGGLFSYLPLLIFIPFILLMLWQSRSQQKRQQKVLSDLKKGDLVLTQAGIRGKLVELGDRYAKVEIAPGTKIEILKTSLLGKDTPEAAQQLEKK
jgi:preprotein translocase subunit YajC